MAQMIRILKAGIFDKTLIVESIAHTKDELTGVEYNALLTLLEGQDIIGKDKCYLNFEENTDQDLIEVARGYFSDVPLDTKVIRK